MIWTAVGAEEQIHQRRNVGVIAGFAFPGMMPMVELRRANQHPERPDRQAHIGMDVDGPQTAEGQQAGDRFQRKAEQESRQIDQAHGIDGIQRMLAMSRQPVQVLGAVMYGMETPEKTDSMLQPMAPIDKQIT